jgi:hypothetical protein
MDSTEKESIKGFIGECSCGAIIPLDVVLTHMHSPLKCNGHTIDLECIKCDGKIADIPIPLTLEWVRAYAPHLLGENVQAL